MRDLSSNIGVKLALAPAVLAATTKGLAIDTNGFNSIAFAISTGAIAGAGDFTAKVQESDTTTDADFTDVAADQVDSNAPATLAASSAYKIGVRSYKQFVRVVLTLNSGTSIVAGATAVLGDAAVRPVA